MSPLAHQVVSNAGHLDTLAKLYTQLLDAGQQADADAIFAGMAGLIAQLQDSARLLIAMGCQA